MEEVLQTKINHSLVRTGGVSSSPARGSKRRGEKIIEKILVLCAAILF
jgi:creatinine amidohydrolase/Fe(II)-dependent formamide hydrolase-like protein